LPVEQHPAHVTEPSEETVGQRIRRLRLERGLSQRELAEPGISYAYLSRIEAGQRQPSVKALRIVAKKLGVSVEQLETGAPIPALARRELQLSDAELALRLATDLDHADALFADVLAEADEENEPAFEARAAAGLGLIAAHRRAADRRERSGVAATARQPVREANCRPRRRCATVPGSRPRIDGAGCRRRGGQGR
jgi:transcriptional regulator with XRE-family HTH domain